MSEDLITWLRAQLDEDERLLGEHPDDGDVGSLVEELGLTAEVESNYPCSPYLRIAKKRALAEVETKRRILDAGRAVEEHEQEGDYIRFGDWRSCSDNCGPDVWYQVIRLLALPYADRPGYRPEWAPPNG